MATIVALHSETHGDMLVKNQPDFSIAKDQNILPVVVQEFIPASVEFLIAFVKTSNGDTFQPVMVTGLKPQQNFFSNGDNWTGLYMPSVMWNSPFKLMANPKDPDALLLAIDEDSDLVSKGEGEALYDPSGKETAFHEQRRQAVINNFEFGQTTQGFSQLLVHLDLLKQQTISVELKGEKMNLEGLYMIDAEKLNALSDEQFKDLRTRGFLPVIYAQMTSWQNIHHLLKMANEQA